MVAECKECLLLEAVVKQDAKDRVFLFIQYLYPEETRKETRKIPKKWADLWDSRGSNEDFIDFGFAATVKI